MFETSKSLGHSRDVELSSHCKVFKLTQTFNDSSCNIIIQGKDGDISSVKMTCTHKQVETLRNETEKVSTNTDSERDNRGIAIIIIISG